MNKISVILLVACLGQALAVLDPKVVCYYDYWLLWRTGQDKFTISDIDSALCTHIVYSALRVTSYGEIDYPDQDLMVGSGHDLEKFANHKGSAKALISFLNNNMASMVADVSTRTAFVGHVVKLLDNWRLDGIVLEWPAFFSDDFVQLLHELRIQFSTRYTLGITVASQPGTFKPDQVNRWVDFYSVQTYDYHGTWENKVGHEAPSDMVMKTLKDWENAGADASKLLMTVPLFGRTWLLANLAETTPGSAAKGAGHAGPWTQVEGKLGYNELCMQMEASPSDWEVHPDTKVNAMYAVNKRTATWVTFESALTAQQKTKLVTSQGYGGAVALYLENDDYGNYCSQGRYPILHGINDGLDKNPVTRAPVTATTPVTRVTPDPNAICKKTGTVRDPKDCNVYHKCTEFLPGVISDDIEHCPYKDEAYDETDGKCKDHKLVKGCENMVM